MSPVEKLRAVSTKARIELELATGKKLSLKEAVLYNLAFTSGVIAAKVGDV